MSLKVRTLCALAVVVVIAVTAPPPARAQLQLGKPGERSLRLSGRVQVRYTAVDQSEAEESSFQVRRVRVKLDGDAHENVRYEVQIGALSGSFFDPDRVQLLDADVAVRFRDVVQIKAGQFKAPFGREFLTTSAELPSIDRALVEALVPNRQIGVMLTSAPDATDLAHGAKGRRFDYGVGAFNGNGINTARNDNGDLMFAGRLVVRPDDHLSVGGNFFTSRDSAGVSRATVGLATIGRRTGFGGDARLEIDRFRVQGEFVQVSFDPEGGGTAERTLRGFFLQPGVFLVPDRLEGFVRYEQFDPDTDSEDNSDKRWTHVGLSYYVKGHDFKLQVEYILKKEDGVAIDDDVALAQVQVAW